MRYPKTIRILPRLRTWVLPATLLLLPTCTMARADRPIPKPNRNTAVKREVPAPPRRVGGIIINGNETIPQDVILRELPLYTGALLTLADVRTAERNLARLGLFEVDRAKGVRPRVEIVDPNGTDSPYKDICVTVKERPHAYLCWQSVETTRALTAFRVNRDPLPLLQQLCRWYWSMDRVLSEWRFWGRQ
jgi:hypothetical protein